MSHYTSGNNAPTLMKQHAIRKGNETHPTMNDSTGVTAVTIKKGATHHAPGHQTPPHASDKNVVHGRHQKVEVHQPKAYVTTATNCGYMDKDRMNFLK